MPFGVTGEHYDSDMGATVITNVNYTKKEDEKNLKKQESFNKQRFVIDEIQHLQQFSDQIEDNINPVEVSCRIDDYINGLKDKYFK